MRTLLSVAFTTLIAFPLSSSSAEACSCPGPDVRTSFDNNTDAAIVQVRHRRNTEDELLYATRVRAVAKGCTERGDRVILSTEPASEMCGVTNLRPGNTYMIFGTEDGTLRDSTVLNINLCDANKSVRELTRSEIRFLRRSTEECDTGTTEPSCEEYKVDEFGMCDMVLGYGRQAETGMCGAISGCELPDDVTLFASAEECYDTCIVE